MRTLRVLELHPHISTPPPTATAIHIFGNALAQEEEPEIIEEVKLGFAEIRHITYPSAPSLMLPVFEPKASSRPSSPMEVVQHENIVLPSRMKRCHKTPKDDVVDLPEPPKRQKANEEESTDSTFVLAKPAEPSTLESEISTIEISPPIERFHIAAKVTGEIVSNGVSRATPTVTNGLTAINANQINDTDEDMLMSFCDEPVQ